MKKKAMPKPPKFYEQFVKKYPQVHDLGPLNDRDRALIKLAISGSHLYSSAFKAHIRKAIVAGISREEIEHLVLLFFSSVGFPAMMAAMGIVEEQLQKKG